MLLALWVQAPSLVDKYRITIDVQNFYWTARAQEPTLFNRDLIYMVGRELVEVDLFGGRLFLMPNSLGYSLIFFLGSTLLDYVWLSKLAVFVLMPLCVTYLFKLGQHLKDDVTGLSLSLFFAFFILASAESISLTTGLQRAFTIPLLIVLLYYLIKEQYWPVGLMLFVCALIYFPILPLAVLTTIFSLIRFDKKKTLSPPSAAILPFMLGLTLSGVAAAFFFSIDSKLYIPYTPIAPLPNFNDNVKLPILHDPRFQAGGYAPMFDVFPILGRTGLFDTGTDLLNVLLFMLLGWFIYQVLGRSALQRVPRPVWGLLLAGLIMYAASLFFIVVLSSTALYLPSRYSRSAFFMVGFFIVGLNWVDFINQLPRWLIKNSRVMRMVVFFTISLGLTLLIANGLLPQPSPFVPTIVLLGLLLSGLLTVFGTTAIFWLIGRRIKANQHNFFLTLLIILLTMPVGANYLRTLPTPTLNPSASERALDEFVATLPKDVMIAGDPNLMTAIPLFAKRMVLFRRLHPLNDYAILDYFEAKYAESPQPLEAFCQKYGVTHLAFDTTTFSPDYLAQKNFFHEPYNHAIIQFVKGKKNFVFPKLSPIFRHGSVVVVSCAELGHEQNPQ